MGPSAVALLLGALVTPPRGAIEATWDAPAACPDREALLERTRARLPEHARGPAAIRGQVRTSASGYALTLELVVADGPPTRRELEAPLCDELVDAAALVVAVALDPVFAAVDPAIERAVEGSTPTRVDRVVVAPRGRIETSPRPTSAPRTSAPRPRRETMRALGIGLRPSVGAWFGALPRVAPTIGFDVVLPARRALRGELGVLAIPRQRTAVATDAGAQLWLATAIVRACFAPAVGRVRPMGCAGFAVGAIGGRGRGSAVMRPGDVVQAWASASAAAGLGIALGRRIELFARAEGHVHARRPGFHLDAIGTVHRVGATSVTALGGLQAVLP